MILRWSLAVTLLYFYSASTEASKLYWQIKKEIGDVTLWKSTTQSEIRGSSQTKKGNKALFDMKNKSTFIKKLEEKKREGLGYLGINRWTPKNYNWDQNSLTIDGDYYDSQNTKTYFKEVIYFQKDRQINLLLTSNKENNLNENSSIDFFSTAKRWEDSK